MRVRLQWAAKTSKANHQDTKFTKFTKFTKEHQEKQSFHNKAFLGVTLCPWCLGGSLFPLL
jgi:hypothetical protein